MFKSKKCITQLLIIILSTTSCSVLNNKFLKSNNTKKEYLVFDCNGHKSLPTISKFDTSLLKNKANLGESKSVYSFYDTEDSLNWYTNVDKYIYEYKLSNDSISIIERISTKCSNDIRFVRYYKSGEIKEVKEYYYEVPIFIKKYAQNGDVINDSIIFSDRQLSKLKKFIKSNLKCNPNCKNYKVRNIFQDSKNLFIGIVVGHEVINKPGFNILKSPHLIYFLNSNTLELMKIEKINRNSNGDEFEYFGE